MKRPTRSTVAVLALAVACLAFIGWVIAKPQSSPAYAGPVPSATMLPPQPAALWVGDSYTAGAGGGGPSAGEACLTSAAFGWVCNLDAEGSTGFTADGHQLDARFQPLIGRLPRTAVAYRADIIFVDAGRNDGSLASFEKAADGYLTQLRADFPKAKLVLIVPYFMRSTGELREQYPAFYAAEARKFGGVVIDPIGEGWIGPQSAALVYTDNVHPNAAGYHYISDHLVADLRRLGLDKIDAASAQAASASFTDAATSSP